MTPKESRGPYLGIALGLSLAGAAFPACAVPRDRTALAYIENTQTPVNCLLNGTDLNGNLYNFEISADRYQHYCNISPGNRLFTPFGAGRYVTHKDPDIVMIAEKLTQGAKTNEEKAEHLLEWVQKTIGYDYIETSHFGEHARFPIETLFERRGDCEDTAALYAALCRAAGLDVCVLIFWGHAAVGVAGNFCGTYYTAGGKDYFVAETTSSDKIGVASVSGDRRAFVYRFSKSLGPGDILDTQEYPDVPGFDWEPGIISESDAFHTER